VIAKWAGMGDETGRNSLPREFGVIRARERLLPSRWRRADERVRALSSDDVVFMIQIPRKSIIIVIIITLVSPPHGIFVPVPTFFARKDSKNYDSVVPPLDAATQVALPLSGQSRNQGSRAARIRRRGGAHHSQRTPDDDQSRAERTGRGWISGLSIDRPIASRRPSSCWSRVKRRVRIGGWCWRLGTLLLLRPRKVSHSGIGRWRIEARSPS